VLLNPLDDPERPERGFSWATRGSTSANPSRSRSLPTGPATSLPSVPSSVIPAIPTSSTPASASSSPLSSPPSSPGGPYNGATSTVRSVISPRFNPLALDLSTPNPHPPIADLGTHPPLPPPRPVAESEPFPSLPTLHLSLDNDDDAHLPPPSPRSSLLPNAQTATGIPPYFSPSPPTLPSSLPPPSLIHPLPAKSEEQADHPLPIQSGLGRDDPYPPPSQIIEPKCEYPHSDDPNPSQSKIPVVDLTNSPVKSPTRGAGDASTLRDMTGGERTPHVVTRSLDTPGQSPDLTFFTPMSELPTLTPIRAPAPALTNSGPHTCDPDPSGGGRLDKTTPSAGYRQQQPFVPILPPFLPMISASRWSGGDDPTPGGFSALTASTTKNILLPFKFEPSVVYFKRWSTSLRNALLLSSGSRQSLRGDNVSQAALFARSSDRHQVKRVFDYINEIQQRCPRDRKSVV